MTPTMLSNIEMSHFYSDFCKYNAYKNAIDTSMSMIKQSTIEEERKLNLIDTLEDIWFQLSIIANNFVPLNDDFFEMMGKDCQDGLYDWYQENKGYIGTFCTIGNVTGKLDRLAISLPTAFNVNYYYVVIDNKGEENVFTGDCELTLN